MATVMPVHGILCRSARRCVRSVPEMQAIGEFLSPNCGPRRGGVLPDMIVLHYTAMESCAAAQARLCDPAAEVSAHYLISETGAVLALVPEELRAWHAGAGSWGAVSDVNSRSVGIELSNSGAQPFSEPQMAALESLLADVMRRWSIPPARVIAHSDMAPGRKGDPGARFDWRRLALAGLSIWPGDMLDDAVGADDEADAREAAFQAAARAFGYPQGDAAATLAAFRLRFRPWAQGALQDSDRAAIADLAMRFPVDAIGVEA